MSPTSDQRERRGSARLPSTVSRPPSLTPERSPKEMHPYRIVALVLVLATGCASEKAKVPWIDVAREIGVPREEVASIAESAAKAHDLEIVGISKEGTDVIAVHLAKSRTASGGLIVYFRRSATGWVEDTSAIAPWDRK